MRSPARLETSARRAFTLMEVLLTIVIGSMLATMAYGVLELSAQAARRVDFRLALAADAEPALDRLNRQLDYMLPYGVPGVDYSLESFEPGRVRFFSSRDLQIAEGFRLVEIHLQTPEEAEEVAKRNNKPSGQWMMVSVHDEKGAFLYNDYISGYHFLKGHTVSLAFEGMEAPRLPEPPRITPLSGANGERPAGVIATLRIEPEKGPAGNALPPALEVQSVWLSRAGMEASP